MNYSESDNETCVESIKNNKKQDVIEINEVKVDDSIESDNSDFNNIILKW